MIQRTFRNPDLGKRTLCAAAAFCAALLVFAVCGETFAANPRHIIIIGWDGGPREQLNDLLARNELPNLKELVKEGILVDLRAADTQSAWSRALTGYEPGKTAVGSNDRNQPIPAGYTIFERAEQALGAGNIYTAMIAAQSVPAENYANAKSGMDLFRDGLQSADEAAKLALQTIEGQKNRRMLLFIHLANPGLDRHSGSPQEREQGLKQQDAWTGVILRKLRGLGIYKDALIYIAANPGFDESLKSDKIAPSQFLATNDKQVRRGGDSVDLAPTVLVRLGIDVAAIAPKLDGTPLSQAKDPVKTAAMRQEDTKR